MADTLNLPPSYVPKHLPGSQAPGDSLPTSELLGGLGGISLQEPTPNAAPARPLHMKGSSVRPYIDLIVPTALGWREREDDMGPDALRGASDVAAAVAAENLEAQLRQGRDPVAAKAARTERVGFGFLERLRKELDLESADNVPVVLSAEEQAVIGSFRDVFGAGRIVGSAKPPGPKSSSGVNGRAGKAVGKWKDDGMDREEKLRAFFKRKDEAAARGQRPTLERRIPQDRRP